ncbi:short-subunit dehydrogenase [Nitrospirillum viridazoti]|nr:short-subunit dehydrogenase [Nitrospirillum amazonense]
MHLGAIMKKKKPQVFFITGAASGIGAATARLLASQGHAVMLADINAKGVRDVAASLGSNADAVALDITSPAAWEAALDLTYSRFGTLDVLVNNAAIVVTGNARDVPVAHHQRTININFMGPLTGSLATLERFRAQGHGHVVTVCSMVSFMPFPGIASYGASKQALRAFHHALAFEERNTGVDFTIVHPTATETPMLEQEERDDACGFAFLADPVSPEFVAETVVTAIRRKSIEVFMPPEQAKVIRSLGTDAPRMRKLYAQMEEIGRSAQHERRQSHNPNSH